MDVNPTPHYKWFFAAPWIQDDWRLNNKWTLNLGFRWDFNGSVTEEDNMLNYAFDPTLVNPVTARVGQQVLGGIRFAGVDGAPDRPWKYDKNNYQFRIGTAYSINEKTVLRGGWGKYFLNPTSQSFNAGFFQKHADHRVARRRPDADLRAFEPLANRHPVAARQRSRPAHLPRAQSELLEP